MSWGDQFLTEIKKILDSGIFRLGISNFQLGVWFPFDAFQFSREGGSEIFFICIFQRAPGFLNTPLNYFFLKTEPNQICAETKLVGDGICDDNTNTPECAFDGGDCCRKDTVKDLCTDCKCHLDQTLEEISSKVHIQPYCIKTSEVLTLLSLINVGLQINVGSRKNIKT